MSGAGRKSQEVVAVPARELTVREAGRRGGARNTPAQRAAWAKNRSLGWGKRDSVGRAWRGEMARIAVELRGAADALATTGSPVEAVGRAIAALPCPHPRRRMGVRPMSAIDAVKAAGQHAHQIAASLWGAQRVFARQAPNSFSVELLMEIAARVEAEPCPKKRAPKGPMGWR